MDVKDPMMSFTKSRRTIADTMHKLQIPAQTTLSSVRPGQAVRERLGPKNSPGQLHKNIGIVVTVSKQENSHNLLHNLHLIENSEIYESKDLMSHNGSVKLSIPYRFNTQSK